MGGVADRSDLASAELAANAARELFARFGLDVSLETLSRIQETVGR